MGWFRKVWSRVSVRLAVSYVLAGVVNLFLLGGLALVAGDILLGRGTVRLVESQLETFRKLAGASAADLADEFAWQATHERPSRRQVRERTAALHGLFPGSEAEIVCEGDEGSAASALNLTELPWLRGDDFVDFVAVRGEIILLAWARHTYGDCFANVVVRRSVNDALAARVSEAVGLKVLPAGPAAISPENPGRAWGMVENSGTALGGDAWWPVIVVARDAETGEAQDWLALQVNPSLGATLRQISRVGQRRAFWTWLLPLLAGGVVIIGTGSMLLAARITKRIVLAINDLTEGATKVGGGSLDHRIPERRQDELGSLAKSFNHMASDLERLIEEVKRKERLEEEIRLAREVQEWLYPRHLPCLPGVEVAVECHPARMVTGDLYDFVETNDGVLGILCADVSGKGVAAALLGASLHSILREYTVYPQRSTPDTSLAFLPPAEIVRYANDELHKRVSPGSYATLFWCDYDTRQRVLRYSNAGHHAPLLVGPSAGTPIRLEAGGVPVGLLPGASYTQHEARLERGSLVVAFTDGIPETANDAGEEFGEERLIRIVMEKREALPSEICAAIVEATRQWSGAQEQFDDITVIAFKAT